MTTDPIHPLSIDDGDVVIHAISAALHVDAGMGSRESITDTYTPEGQAVAFRANLNRLGYDVAPVQSSTAEDEPTLPNVGDYYALHAERDRLRDTLREVLGQFEGVLGQASWSVVRIDDLARWRAVLDATPSPEPTPAAPADDEATVEAIAVDLVASTGMPVTTEAIGSMKERVRTVVAAYTEPDPLPAPADDEREGEPPESEIIGSAPLLIDGEKQPTFWAAIPSPEGLSVTGETVGLRDRETGEEHEVGVYVGRYGDIPTDGSWSVDVNAYIRCAPVPSDMLPDPSPEGLTPTGRTDEGQPTYVGELRFVPKEWPVRELGDEPFAMTTSSPMSTRFMECRPPVPVPAERVPVVGDLVKAWDVTYRVWGVGPDGVVAADRIDTGYRATITAGHYALLTDDDDQ